MARAPGARAPGGWPPGSDLVRIRSLNSSQRRPGAARPARPRSAGRRGAGSRRGPCGRGPAAGSLAQSAGHENASRSAVGEAAGGQPRVGLDHVGGDQGVLQVEDGQLAFGGEHRCAGPRSCAVDGPSPARPAVVCDPGVLDDRRQVDVVHVDGPVDHGRVEANSRLVGSGGRASHSSSRRSTPEDGLGLGVGAVQLDVAEGPLGLPRAAPRAGPPARPGGPGRAARCSTFSARASVVLARCSWRCTRPRPGKDHSGHDDGLALVVVRAGARGTSRCTRSTSWR